MSKTLAVLLATSALTAAIGLPAWSAMRAPADSGATRSFLAQFTDGTGSQAPVFVSGDDEEDDEEDDDHYENDDRDDDHDDDDEEDDHDDCDDGGDDNDCRGSAGSPAPAGTGAPPRNGLFGDGAPPQVQVN